MWTTTRKDMPNAHWVPNHFVPVLQIQYQTRNEQNEASKLKAITEISNNTSKENQGNEEHDEHSDKNTMIPGSLNRLRTVCMIRMIPLKQYISKNTQKMKTQSLMEIIVN